jgi:hypothetical protein
MAKVLAGITTSVDGYITGPDDGPGKGLGEDQREAWMPQPAGVPRNLLWCLKLVAAGQLLAKGTVNGPQLRAFSGHPALLKASSWSARLRIVWGSQVASAALRSAMI